MATSTQVNSSQPSATNNGNGKKSITMTRSEAIAEIGEINLVELSAMMEREGIKDLTPDNVATLKQKTKSIVAAINAAKTLNAAPETVPTPEEIPIYTPPVPEPAPMSRAHGTYTKTEVIRALEVGFNQKLPAEFVQSVPEGTYTDQSIVDFTAQLLNYKTSNRSTAIAIVEKRLGITIQPSEEQLFGEYVNEEEILGLQVQIQIKRARENARQLDAGIAEAEREMAFRKGRQSAQEFVLTSVLAHISTASQLQERWSGALLGEEAAIIEERNKRLLEFVKQRLGEAGTPLPAATLEVAKLKQNCFVNRVDNSSKIGAAATLAIA